MEKLGWWKETLANSVLPTFYWSKQLPGQGKTLQEIIFFSIWNLCKSEEELWLNNTIYRPSKLDNCPCIFMSLPSLLNSKISTIQKYFTKLDETIIKLTHFGFLFCKINAMVLYANHQFYIVFNLHILEQCKEAWCFWN